MRVRTPPRPPIFMKKYFIISLATLLLTVGIHAQETNVHIFGGNHHTIGAGVDYRQDKNLISVDGDVSKICKTPGGCGHQYSIRGIFAHKLNSVVSVQGGALDSYYKVDLFDKNSFQLLGGVRLAAFKEKSATEINYRHDLTSENKIREIEVQETVYFPKHIFLRVSGSRKRFRDFYHEVRYANDGQISIGVHF